MFMKNGGGGSVCIQEENMSRYVRPRFEGPIQYLTLKMNDDEDQNLISLFIEFVYSHIPTFFY